MSKDKLLYAIGINVLMSLVLFKQLFKVGCEVSFLNLTSIILTPFVLSYSLMVLFTIPFLFSSFNNKERNNFVNLLQKIIITGVFGILILAPFRFLYYNNGYVLTLPFILILLEPLKVKHIYNQDYGDTLGRNITLLILSFILLFVSGIICRMLQIANTQFMYGGLYYLILAYLDLKIYKKQNIVK
jgi:hypothetical protein